MTEAKPDHEIFRVTNFLIRGGCPEGKVLRYLEIFAKSLDAPFSLNEIRAMVKSAIESDRARRRDMAQRVIHWVEETCGYFSLNELYRALQVVTSDEKAKVRQKEAC